MKKLSDKTPTKLTKATVVPSLRPGPKGCVEVDGDSHIFVGGLPGKPPKGKK
jgi:hypothetical protein